jgi:hypothetical protein
MKLLGFLWFKIWNKRIPDCNIIWIFWIFFINESGTVHVFVSDVKPGVFLEFVALYHGLSFLGVHIHFHTFGNTHVAN